MRQIQRLFERTYAAIGINLEDCLIGLQRCRQLTALAGPQAQELSPEARTFLRCTQGSLRVGIYYSPGLIEQLENHDPRGAISSENISALIAFIEEINHALHAALLFLRGVPPDSGEDYARNLELQAAVDTYLTLLFFVAFFRRPAEVSPADRRWLRRHCFLNRIRCARANGRLGERYHETIGLAARYTRHLERLAPAERVREIRTFYRLNYGEKVRRISQLSTQRPAFED